MSVARRIAPIVFLEVPAFCFLVFAVAGEQLKIVRAVICNIMVNMMHDFGAQKRTAFTLSNDQAMLHHVTVFARHADKFGRAAHILDARRIAAFALAECNAAPPCWIVRAAHFIGALSYAFCGWYKLGLLFALPMNRAPFMAAWIRAEMKPFAFALPCFRLEETSTAIVASGIGGVLIHTSIISQAAM